MILHDDQAPSSKSTNFYLFHTKGPTFRDLGGEIILVVHYSHNRSCQDELIGEEGHRIMFRKFVSELWKCDLCACCPEYQLPGRDEVCASFCLLKLPTFSQTNFGILNFHEAVFEMFILSTDSPGNSANQYVGISNSNIPSTIHLITIFSFSITYTTSHFIYFFFCIIKRL